MKKKCFQLWLYAFVMSVIATSSFADWIDGAMKTQKNDAIVPAVRPFPLEQVRLTPSVFASVQNLEKEYLLSLDPDRFLIAFRKEAGLSVKADAVLYGGWEATTDLKGHSFGHFLTAASKMYAATGNEQLKKLVDKSVAGLAEVQNAFGKDPRWEGYVSAIPHGKELFDRTAKGDVEYMGRKWIVPFYTQHKILAGLLDAYRYCNNEQALVVAQKHVDWMIRFFNPLNADQFERMLHTEFGGIETPILELYSITGEQKYLDFGKRFEHKAMIESWKNRTDNLPGIHANTQIPKAQACAKLYEITGDKTQKTAADFFWNTVVYHHTYITGGNSAREHFGPEDKFDNRFENPTETCNTYNMLKLTEHLYSWNPNNPTYMEFYERALYNHILGAINHKACSKNGFENGMTCYYIHFKPGDHRNYEAPYDAFTCCFGTGMENPSKYGAAIYWHDLDNKNLYVNLFIPSQLQWTNKGVTAELKTEYPANGKVSITFTAQKDATFTCYVRVPSWTNSDKNYQTFPVELKSGEQKTVSVDYPMALRTESMTDNVRHVGIFYGPTLLTADLGPTDQTSLIPAVVSQSKNPSDWLTPVKNQPLRFTSKPGAFTQDGLMFLPFYALHERNNCIFFHLLTPEQVETYKLITEKRIQEEKELEARTVDRIAPGEMQSERDHKIEFDNSETGPYNGRKYRHSFGGWFSYEIKLNPTLQNELLLDFWGSDSGNRVFTVSIDGQNLETIALKNAHPGQFYTHRIVIPQNVTSGKTKATLRFSSQNGSTVGGVFGIRIVTKK